VTAVNLRTLTVTEVVAATGLTRREVYRLVRSGQLSAIRLSTGRSAKIRVSEHSLSTLITGTPATGATPARQAPRRRARALDADAALPPIDNPAFA
jgi:excisionase family DNA binding protein